MPIGLGTALALQAGTSGAGILANELLNPEPEIPDLSAEAAAEFNERRRELSDVVGQRRQELAADLAASGQTGSAGASARQKVFGEFAGAQVDLASRGAEAVSRAQEEEERLQFQRDQQEQRQRAQGIANLVRGVGQGVIANQIGGGGDSGASDAVADSAIGQGQRAGFLPEEQGFSDVFGGGAGAVASESDGGGDASGLGLANMTTELLENKYGIPTR